MCVNKLLLNNTKIEVAFKSTKLSSCFNAKDKIDFKHNYDLIYHALMIMWEKVLVE